MGGRPDARARQCRAVPPRGLGRRGLASGAAVAGARGAVGVGGRRGVWLQTGVVVGAGVDALACKPHLVPLRGRPVIRVAVVRGILDVDAGVEQVNGDVVVSRICSNSAGGAARRHAGQKALRRGARWRPRALVGRPRPGQAGQQAAVGRHRGAHHGGGPRGYGDDASQPRPII